MRARSKGLANMTPLRGLLFVLVAGVGLGAGARATQAGTLEIHESSVSIGQVRTIAGQVTNTLIDLDYAPSTAEGGKLFGMSELEIQTTGNLVLTPVGFTCQAMSCLYSPQPFVSGKRIRVTAGNDLAGETASAANLLTIGVTGSIGHIVITGGEYIDGTGTAGSVGSVRVPDVTILVTVPEPELAAGLAGACALLAFAASFTGRRERPGAVR